MGEEGVEPTVAVDENKGGWETSVIATYLQFSRVYNLVNKRDGIVVCWFERFVEFIETNEISRIDDS